MATPFTDPPDQLGCVVPDLDAAIAEWAARGVGPFLVMKNVTLTGFTYEGRAVEAEGPLRASASRASCRSS